MRFIGTLQKRRFWWVKVATKWAGLETINPKPLNPKP